MAKFVLPFVEVQRGRYVIEAGSLAEARAIVEVGDFTEDHEPFYKDGVVEWDVEDLEEVQ